MFRSSKRKLVLQDVKANRQYEMEVSSPKLAIGIRGKQEVAEAVAIDIIFY